MSDESLNDTVIGVFNNWFLKQHGLLPQQAIARITELPIGTVKNRIFRAREMLRVDLADVLDLET